MLEEFKKDLINSMKEKDKVKLDTLRGVKGAMQLEMINKKQVESDDLLLDVINKQIKLRNDSIEQFKSGGRNDLVESYQKEIEILKKYMPSMLSDDELNNIILEVFDNVKPTSIKDLGTIMKEITPKVKNRCDMSKLNKMIREKLN